MLDLRLEERKNVCEEDQILQTFNIQSNENNRKDEKRKRERERERERGLHRHAR